MGIRDGEGKKRYLCGIMEKYWNSGRKGPGKRFRFVVRELAHRSLYLPLSMKGLEPIRRLMEGESPMKVFGVGRRREAVERFCELRKRYDFAFWAATEYRVRDVWDPDEIVPFVLNESQRRITDVLERRYYDRKYARYIILKEGTRAGVTTLVQAYMLWRQLYKSRINSCTINATDFSNLRLRGNLYRYLGKEVMPAKRKISIPGIDCSAYFNSVRTPDALRGINFAYVHLVDMEKWNDSRGSDIDRTYVASISGVLSDYGTLIVLEAKMGGAATEGLLRRLLELGGYCLIRAGGESSNA